MHVTLRLVEGLPSLRTEAAFQLVQRALLQLQQRGDVRVPRFTVQGNHIHMLVEADDRLVFSRGMRGFCIRLARSLNRLWSRKGQVLAHRYHARALPTPTEVLNAMSYVRNNRRAHLAEAGRRGSDEYRSAVDHYSSDALLIFKPPEPSSWLLREGWKRVFRRRAGG